MPSDDAASELASPYQSLYRRFRPQSFAELRGQEHVALALNNAVRDERVGHAYLFSGPRGTGKTSTARILAKALNCTALVGGEPCGVCESCRSITNGTSFDVHELDAASNNGVDAMRDLVARASLATPGRWKVYIVDEVHMLSVAASNALLKTLEEPPSHVVFVLATTDPHKVLPTIRSRTQHFEFHLLSEETLSSLVTDVARDAHLELPSGALASAVRRGRGSARDALSVLDQVAAAGVVEDDSGLFGRVITAIGEFDSAGAIVGLDRAVRAGHDPQQLAIGLIEQLRAGFLVLASGGALPDGPTSLPADELEAVQSLGLVRCVRALEVIGTALVAMRESPEPRVTLEVALIRLSHPEADTSPEALVERLERLERRLDALAVAEPVRAPISPTHEPRGSADSGPRGDAPPRDDPLPRDNAAPRDDAPPRAGEPPSPPEATSPEAAATPRSRPALGAFPSTQPASTAAAATEQPSATETTSMPEARPPEVPQSPTTSAGEIVGGSNPLPTRDALVLAWGDHVIQQLRPKVRAIFQIGHFVGTDGDVALLAVPNQAHLSHAQPLIGEVAAALSKHFGYPVAVRLVTESAAENPPAPDDVDASPGAPEPARVETPPTDHPDEESFDDIGAAIEEGNLPNATVGLALAKDRLLQAFPGAEEVDRT